MSASEKLRALSEAATPGPWQHSGDEEGRAGPKPTSHWDYYLSQEDADLVVTLVNALPLIADVVEAAETWDRVWTEDYDSNWEATRAALTALREALGERP